MNSTSIIFPGVWLEALLPGMDEEKGLFSHIVGTAKSVNVL